MKEDILEQIVDDWLISKEGAFTKHNVKFRPDSGRDDYNSKDDSSYSDIDILAVHVLSEIPNQKVSIVSCKSWQEGFGPEYWLKKLTLCSSHETSKKKYWKYFRELVMPKWTEAFVQKIKEETGQTEFTYYLAITKIKGKKDNRKCFEENEIFLNNLKNAGVKKPLIKIITFEEIFFKYFDRSNKQTLEATEVGRLLQLMKASNIKIVRNKN